MWETILFLLPPFTVCLLLAGLLSYFGNHILSREVIFVDIAVAQVASLGTMIGIMMGMTEGTLGSYLFSLAFTVIIVSIFAVSKFKNKELSQEVTIGIIYCMALAIAMLLVDSVTGGSNFIQKTFSGAILWVTWTDVLITALIFAPLFVIHMFFQKSFIRISDGDVDGYKESTIKLYNLIFYITFGIAVVQSVKIGGIFVVFMYLIGPAAMALFITDVWKLRFFMSWLMGFIGSVLGISVSYNYNLPNGPTIVCMLGVMLFITSLATRKREVATNE